MSWSLSTTCPHKTTLESGVVTREKIPQAHKIALVDIPAGGEILRYGVVLGYAKNDIPAGSWINEHMLDLPESPALTDMPWGTSIKTPDELPTPPRTTWMGYRNKVGPAGTRNLLGIVTTVQCAAGVVKVAVERIKRNCCPSTPTWTVWWPSPTPMAAAWPSMPRWPTFPSGPSPTSSATPTSAVRSWWWVWAAKS